MRKIFILRLAVLGAAIVTASAFTKPEAKPVTNNDEPQLEWFVYTPGPGGESEQSNYEKQPLPSDCDGSSTRCAIQAEEDGSSNMPKETGENSIENPSDVAFHR